MADPRPADLTAQEREAVNDIVTDEVLAIMADPAFMDRGSPMSCLRVSAAQELQRRRAADRVAPSRGQGDVVKCDICGFPMPKECTVCARSPAPVASPERPAKQVLATVEMEGDRVVYRPAGPETGWLTMSGAHYDMAKRVVTHGFLPTWVVVAMENVLVELDATRSALSAATERAEKAERALAKMTDRYVRAACQIADNEEIKNG